MQRINPTSWNLAYGYDQGQVRTGTSTVLTIAGQGSLDQEGRLLHDGDVAAQFALAMTNVESVLDAAGMTLTDLAQLRIHVTDIDAALRSYDILVERLATAGATPPATLVEVRRLAVPGMAVEIDALAIR
jgi:enamine deaminase RidA (YjgF/YER057c/UK114 family)